MKQSTEIWLVVLILVFVGIVFSLPLAFNLNSAIPYSLYPAHGFETVNMMHGDHLQFFYTLSQFGDYLREGNSAFFEEPYEFTISGSERHYSPRELPLSVFFFLLSPFGNAVAYNVLVIFSFVACGVSVFLLSGRYIRGFLPRLISSVIFAIFPFRLAQLYGGHPNAFLVFLMPLLLYGYESWMESGKWKYALLSGVCIMSMAVEELHLAYYSALFTVFFFAYKGISMFRNFKVVDSRLKHSGMTVFLKHLGMTISPDVSFPRKRESNLKIVVEKHRWKETLQRFTCLTLVIAVFWMLAAGYIMHVKQVVFEPSVAHAGREVGEIGLYAPKAGDFFRRANRDSEKFIYLGVVSFLLVLFAFFGHICKWFNCDVLKFSGAGSVGQKHIHGACPVEKIEGLRKNKIKWFYLAIFIVSAILSLGPNLRIFPLYNLFYKYVPFFNYPRSTARIIIFAFLSISILAGFALENMVKLRRGRIACVIAIILLMLDFHPLGRIGLCRLSKGNRVYEYIREKGDSGVLLEIPLWPGDSSWSSIYEYYATLYHIPMINGYSSFVTRDYIENVFWPLVSINMGCLNKSQFELLQKLNVRYIILHEEAYPQKVSPFPFKIALCNMRNSPLVKFVKQDGPLYLFEMDDDFSADYLQYSVPSKMGVFYECEHMPSRGGKVVLDVDASGGRARYAGEEAEGEVHSVFGPWQLFSPGRYKIIFRIKGNPSYLGKDFARIEVTADKGQEMISNRMINGDEVTADYSDYEIHFAISSLKQLEFRIATFGNGRTFADYIYLIFQGEDDPLLNFEAEDMFHTGREVRDEDASGKASIYGNPVIDPPDRLVFGGRRRYGRGKYAADFILKVDERVRETAATLKVMTSGLGIILAEKEVCGVDFEEVGKYQSIEVPFSLNKMQVIEFEVDFKKKTGVWVDRIKIYPHPYSSLSPLVKGVGGFKSGLLRHTYRGMDFSGMSKIKVDLRPSVYYSKRKQHEPFSIIWTGYLRIDKEGEYRIGTLSDDDSWVYVDGKKVVDNSDVHSARFMESKIYLTRGYHSLKLKYIAGGGDELFRLYWMKPGEWPITVPVPAENLFH